MKTKQTRVLSILIALCMVLAFMPAFSLVASAAPVANVKVNGWNLNSYYQYLTNGGFPSETGELGVDAVAYFDAASGTLWLQDYHFGSIMVSSASALDLSIKLVGNNTIEGSTAGLLVGGVPAATGILHFGGNIIISSECGGKLTVNADGTKSVRGIVATDTGYVKHNITISGDANVTVIADGEENAYGLNGKNVKIQNNAILSVTVSALEDACGLFGENINIQDDAALSVSVSALEAACGLAGDNINVLNKATLSAIVTVVGSTYTSAGIWADKKITFNTTEAVTLDASGSGCGSAFVSEEGATLTKASVLTLKYKNSEIYYGSFSYSAADFIVANPNSNTRTYTYAPGMAITPTPSPKPTNIPITTVAPSPTPMPTSLGAAPTPTPFVDSESFITDDHFAYIKGYEDGSFRPANNLTRAEAAVMFTRVMKQKMPGSFAFSGMFSDVKASDWFAKEVEYLASLKIITGYDETGGGKYFDSYGQITRAEFATIASRFGALLTSNNIAFSDVPSSHWAYKEIISVAAKGWIKGYDEKGGGKYFSPAGNITRAEVVTMLNRMLGRVYDEAWGGQGLIIPGDVSKSYWAYSEILEAMNAHDYQIVNGKEVWTKIK